MKQEDIIRMAREAGLPEIIDNANIPWAELSIFAVFIRADEREACAKVCDAESIPQHDEILSDAQWSAKVLAGKIRARGQA
jgi:hypothetical protein